MWTQQQATPSLQSVVALVGGRVEDYALHFLRTGDATHLSAGGANSEVLTQRSYGYKGRWALMGTRRTFAVTGRMSVG